MIAIVYLCNYVILFLLQDFVIYIICVRSSREGTLSSWLVMQRLCMERTLIQIPYQTQIGEGLYIGHFGHIIINPGSKIGKNFSVAAGVLIGNAQGKCAGTPTIGDNVRVGQNAIVIGKINIGNDVLIAPGAFVNFDVPDNCIVIGNPGKIIQRTSSPTVQYIVYPVQNYQ